MYFLKRDLILIEAFFLAAGFINFNGCQKTADSNGGKNPSDSLSITQQNDSSVLDTFIKPHNDIAMDKTAQTPTGPNRIVAIGDIHGDLNAARIALKLGGAIDHLGHWIGGNLIVVQIGDQLDRGDEDHEVFDFFNELAIQAQHDGGRIISLIGNHEEMNVEQWMDYVTEAGFRSFENITGLDLKASWLNAFPISERYRRASFYPGGPYAQLLAQRNIIEQISETVFVHGGILPEHVEYGFQRINKEMKSWLLGKALQPSYVTISETSPLWTTLYSVGTLDQTICATLNKLLVRLKAKRLVIGHSVQLEGINSACDGLVWRIDVGMSRFYYNGRLQILEIVGDKISVLTKE